MAYVDLGIDQRPEVLLNKEDTLQLIVKRNGKLVPLDNVDATVTIMRPTGEVIVAETAADMARVADGMLRYTRTWNEENDLKFELWEDYIAEWKYKVNGSISYDTIFFDVVRMKLPCLIDVNNMLDFYPDLVEHLLAIGESDADKFCRRAWSLMLDRIRSGHNRPSLILDRSRLVNPAVQKALELACDALTKDITDIWTARAAKHLARYNELRSGLGELKYDRDEDGRAGEDDVKRINRRKMTV